MAVTVTVADVAIAIRAATSPEQISDPVRTVLNFLVPAATAIIEEYAPSAPDAVHDAAVVRLAGWLWDSSPTDPGVGQALRISGAAALLGQWRAHRAGAIGTADATPGPAPTPGSGLPPLPGAGSFVLLVVNGELEWVSFPQPS